MIGARKRLLALTVGNFSGIACEFIEELLDDIASVLVLLVGLGYRGAENILYTC